MDPHRSHHSAFRESRISRRVRVVGRGEEKMGQDSKVKHDNEVTCMKKRCSTFFLSSNGHLQSASAFPSTPPSPSPSHQNPALSLPIVFSCALQPWQRLSRDKGNKRAGNTGRKMGKANWGLEARKNSKKSGRLFSPPTLRLQHPHHFFPTLLFLPRCSLTPLPSLLVVVQRWNTKNYIS